MNKKGQLLGSLGKWLIVLGVVLLIGITFIKFYNSTNNTKFEDAKLDDASADNLFTAVWVDITPIPNALHATPCTPENRNINDIAQTVWVCRKGTSVNVSVGIRNTGSRDNTFYAAPILTGDCDGDFEECDSVQDPDKGQIPCLVPAGEEIKCGLGYSKPFADTGRYRIITGARCLPEDCKTISEVFVRNSANGALLEIVE